MDIKGYKNETIQHPTGLFSYRLREFSSGFITYTDCVLEQSINDSDVHRSMTFKSLKAKTKFKRAVFDETKFTLIFYNTTEPLLGLNVSLDTAYPMTYKEML
jgi:hypothetical protein